MKRLKAIALTGLLAAAPPLLQGQTTETYTFTTNRVVPDGNAAGLSETRDVSSAIGDITAVKVRLKVDGEFNGDLYGFLTHSTGFTVLLNRPGKTAGNTAGYSDSGLDITFETGGTNGDIHLYRDITTPADGLPLTGSWEPDGRSTDPADVTDASVRATSLTNFNGLAANGEWTLFLADMVSGGTNMLTEWELEITGSAYPTLTWTNPADIVYGTALSGAQLNASATFDSTNVPGTFNYSPAASVVLNAGANQTLEVTFTPDDTNTFLSISGDVVIKVTPAPLTITAVDKSKAYGQALPAFTAAYDGFVNGDDAADLDTGVTLGTVAEASSPAGTYAITASGAVDANYDITHVNGTLTINQALTSGDIVSSANPAVPGADVTYTMTVNAVGPGAGTPSGTVNFRVDGTLLGTGALSDGVATFITNNLALGTHTIVAEYAGDANFIGITNTLSPDQVINTAPVAGNDTIERYPTGDVKVRLSTLLGNDVDADTDTLTPTINPASANGGTVTVVGAWVFYKPAPGFTNADSFTYTIADGRGGTDTATVTVAIKVDNAASENLTLVDLGNGEIRIDGQGIPGRTYRLQYTESMSPANWVELPDGSVTAGSTGAFSYTDSPPGARYYRTVYP